LPQLLGQLNFHASYQLIVSLILIHLDSFLQQSSKSEDFIDLNDDLPLIDHLAETLSQTAESLSKVDGEKNRLAEALSKTDEEKDRQSESLSKTVEEKDRLAEALSKTDEEKDRLSEALSKMAETLSKTDEEKDRLSEALSKMAEALSKTDEEKDRLSEALSKMAEALSKTDEEKDRLSEALSKMAEEVARLTIELEKASSKLCKPQLNSSNSGFGSARDIFNPPPFPSLNNGQSEEAENGKLEKRKQGAQKGHKKHVRPLLTPEEADETICFDTLKGKTCPDCGKGILEPCPENDKQIDRFELPEILVTKIRNIILAYRCPHCGKIHMSEAPKQVLQASLIWADPFFWG
jgi:myosin heavy subunit/predicted RNA-binding Zn-ribbon protein involved in translation (DUF1610 family)